MASVITPGPISQMVLYTGTLAGAFVPIIVPDSAGTSYTNYRSAISSVPFGLPPTIITSGATTGSPYAVTSSDWLILVNKTVSATTGILLPTSVGRVLPVLVKDLKGDAATFQIDVTFTGGQSADGLTTYSLIGAYVWQWFYPLTSGGWYAA